MDITGCNFMIVFILSENPLLIIYDTISFLLTMCYVLLRVRLCYVLKLCVCFYIESYENREKPKWISVAASIEVVASN